MRDGDSERIKELNAFLGYSNLVGALGVMPYVLETGTAPSDDAFAAPGAPAADAADGTVPDGDEQAAPKPPPAKRTRTRKA
jgi:hypothetical protein